MSHDDGKRGYQEDLNGRLNADGKIPQAPETARIDSERKTAGSIERAKRQERGRKGRVRVRRRERE